jgi:hypothetical protein
MRCNNSAIAVALVTVQIPLHGFLGQEIHQLKSSHAPKYPWPAHRQFNVKFNDTAGKNELNPKIEASRLGLFLWDVGNCTALRVSVNCMHLAPYTAHFITK